MNNEQMAAAHELARMLDVLRFYVNPANRADDILRTTRVIEYDSANAALARWAEVTAEPALPPGWEPGVNAPWYTCTNGGCRAHAVIVKQSTGEGRCTEHRGHI